MNFFKSVFAVDPDPQLLQEDHQQTKRKDDDDEQEQLRLDGAPEEDPHSDKERPSSPTDAGWGFGGLIKTLASRSESVVLTYRRDLLEFGSGLKKETAAIREVAARVVMDLPASLESGASTAQESLESVGQVIDELGDSVWRGTAEIISQGKDVLLAIDGDAGGSSSDAGSAPHQISGSATNRGYNRFDAQLMAVQADQSTYLEDPEDVDDFNLWREGFVVAEKDDEIDELCMENVVLEGMFQKIVPRAVDYDTFWTRYYYKVFKLKQTEDARAKLVKRVIFTEEEENLSWEVDDEDDADISETGVEKEGEQNKRQVDIELVQGDTKHEESKVSPLIATEMTEVANEGVEKSIEEFEVLKNVVEEGRLISPVKEGGEPEDKPVVPLKSNVDVDKVGKSDDDKAYTEGKLEPSESCKGSDISIVSTQPSGQDEDDLGWDEIEDLGENDDNKPAVVSSFTSDKVDLRKRLSTGEDDEDLSWDIDDD